QSITINIGEIKASVIDHLHVEATSQTARAASAAVQAAWRQAQGRGSTQETLPRERAPCEAAGAVTAFPISRDRSRREGDRLAPQARRLPRFPSSIADRVSAKGLSRGSRLSSARAHPPGHRGRERTRARSRHAGPADRSRAVLERGDLARAAPPT